MKERDYIERTPWHDAGFAEPPEQKRANGGERIYRVSGGPSLALGNCFFVPALGAVPINYWTSELLERELNAAVWGNEYDQLHVYTMRPGAVYQIGPVAHHNYAGVDHGVPFTQRAYFSPGGIFKQVTFVLGDGLNLLESVRTEGGPLALSPGRFAREATKRAKLYRQ